MDVYAAPRAAVPACDREDGGPAASSDLALACGAGSGDTAALGELYRRYNRRVYSLCQRMLANTAEAEDLTQEVFIKLFYEAGSFRGESAFTTWLHRLTVNVVLMYLRKHRRRFERPTQYVEIPDQPARGTERPDSVPALDRVRLDRALAALPPGYRAVFVLFDVEGYTHTEIARILGCSHGTSKSQLHKARTKLRALLKQKPPQG
ncbi:MAG TPA: sigma-70 family RNA polymerase sigma factor [Pyrinomonadaceae bacterium]|nr:sigma-70 family RNA polymerase sigma factor [Pyrinomonadaceae bacterium]